MGLLGTVTLLEIKQVPNGNRIAYCLPSGEFIFVANTCAPEFGAANAADLYGDNLFQFLALGDAEKLEDYLRLQQLDNNSDQAFTTTQEMRMVVRLPNDPSTQLWIQLSTIPLTLRMMRCIDTIRSFSTSLGHFADSSSFVLSEDEFSSLLSNPVERTGSSFALGISSFSAAPLLYEDDDDMMFFESKSSCSSPASFTSIVPLELKHRHPNFAMARIHVEDTGTEETSDDDDEDLRASLSNLAFEADWLSETVSDDTAHVMIPAGSITSSSTASLPMATTPRFRAELVT
ncbi:unnamed protein product [Peronospora belbahrii]|uniref:Uncharacterized protein n=1 Tax=Peronospora belbahrii TaxID=622444 RepID=A0AAU9KU05_9STRA|nr:unnamed protein product [Peronospora belbahrii]CAH0518462.1 unnamed protein product [Peronospora belbahrii]